MSEESGKGGLVEVKDSWLWRWGIRSWLFIGVIAAIVVAWAGYTKAHKVLLPLIVAFIVGILLRPFVESMVRHRFPRWLAVVITMFLIIAVLFGVFSLLVYGVSTQASSISRQVKAGVKRLQSWFDNLKGPGRESRDRGVPPEAGRERDTRVPSRAGPVGVHRRLPQERKVERGVRHFLAAFFSTFAKAAV